jgi:predicted Zn-dependent protease
MNPNLLVSYMAEQINRGRLDNVAARGWLADEVAAKCSHAKGPAQVSALLGAALVRLRERILRISQTNETSADHVALPAR